MLVRDYFEMPMAVDAVVARVTDASVWRSVLTDALAPDERRLLQRYRADAVFPSSDEPLCICVAPPRRLPRGTVVDVAWANEAISGREPIMRGDLSCSALGPDWTHVEFTANYTAPVPPTGDPADRLVRQRAGDYAVRLLLTRMAAAIRLPAAPVSTLS